MGLLLTLDGGRGACYGGRRSLGLPSDRVQGVQRDALGLAPSPHLGRAERVARPDRQAGPRRVPTLLPFWGQFS